MGPTEGRKVTPDLLGRSGTHLANYLDHVRQLQVGTKAATLKALSALGASELPWRGWRRGQLGHTPSAKVMTTADGHGILEVVQADGTHGFLLKCLQGISSGTACHLNALPVDVDAPVQSRGAGDAPADLPPSYAGDSKLSPTLLSLLRLSEKPCFLLSGAP